MWELGNPPAMASYHEVMMHEIHVLLVDHDSEGLVNTARLLEMCQYRVTFVELASAAISMLLSGKAKFDVVMANINSPDLHGFKLLQQAVTMGLPVLLMSDDDNTLMAMRALENGAFLYIKKPATMEMLRCLWQHVVRERTRTIRERDLLMAAANHGAQAVKFRSSENPVPANNNLTTMMMMKKNYYNYKPGKSKMMSNRSGKHGFLDDDDQDQFHTDDNDHTILRSSTNFKRKMCTEWTQDLHAKFMDAVEQLGEGRCFPKEILELMNVPGLTRMQVASHLQKCRNDNWRSPDERKSNQTTQPTSTDTNGSQHRTRRFGSKPQLGKSISGRVQDQTTQGSEINSEVNYPRHSSEDQFFNLPEMDCLIQNLPGVQQRTGLENPNPVQGATYNFNPAANYHEQNSGGQSMDNRSHWSSDTSNFESDHSETRDNE